MMFDPATVGIILFVSLIILIILRIPVAYALALAVVPVLILEPRLTPVMLLQRMVKSYRLLHPALGTLLYPGGECHERLRYNQ